MRILITGASGLLGTKLCEIALSRNYEVYSAYNTHEPLYGRPIRLDVSNDDAVEKAFRKIRPEAVVHAAALTHVDKCELEKELAWKINVEGTGNIARLCRRHGAFLVYVSTDYVFDGETGMYKETDKPSPINYYGLTKLKGEEKVKAVADKFCIARASVIYGSVPAAGKVNFALWLLEKLGNKERVKIVTDQWNSPTLNTNLAQMILEVVERKITGTYHLAGATRISRYDFAKLIAKSFNLDERLIIPASSDQFKWAAKRPKDSSLNTQKAQHTLKNKPLEVEQAVVIMKDELLKKRDALPKLCGSFSDNLSF
ncbi:MAG: dTDP-4-dehydrorhamnose reductase [Candidatus Methanomethylicota archaeon]|uniref:dTDP-4-dehydrorhamnose reductase n=1 Tax=Thermoproteota archaeon TaxID=2056631 RepID=A0A497ENC4_9CREN|nr:MAG: dTDP-4-dehydrorhamnose reductase [Candidatus Verstraetearchaeota archaeon]